MKEIYLDGAANTPLDKTVFKQMKPYLTDKFVGNSFAIHDFGIRASQAIEHARMQVAEAVKATPEEVFFTSGATEGNNWIIRSVADEQLANGMSRPKIVCGATEHSSVLKTCLALSDFGFDVVVVKPKKRGSLRWSDVREIIDTKTCLVCVMAVNNETGVNNEVDKIAQLAKRKGAITLSDCTQLMSYGGEYIELCSRYPHVDCFTFSAHKFYGPTGVGAAIIRKDIKLRPFMKGGAQESGMRGGTSNTAGIVGLGAAIEQLHDNYYNAIFLVLFHYFITNLEKRGRLNVFPDHINILSVNFAEYCHTNNLASVLATYGVAVSAGSACDAEHDDVTGYNPSHVLSVLGLPENEIRNTIRISFTKYTTKRDIDYLFKALYDIHEAEMELKK